MRSVGEIVAARYRVVRQIAEGGMGILFEAVHIGLEERVAIKFVRAAGLPADAIARFDREARLAVKLRTEHVARVLDAGRDEAGDPFIVMEYLEGVDLGGFVRTNGPLSAALAADYLVQACHGLAEAHALTIVHRDVKPANLFLTEDAAGLPIIKVLDFGISKAVDGGGEELTASPERAAQLLGTPQYVSPEQLLTPHQVDARADIWSLGVCGWAIATGKLPFSHPDLIVLFASILNNQAPSIATVRPDLPEPFIRAIDRCLQRNRADRFRDVGELAEALGSMTTGRTRLLVEHTTLLLERGRARAAGSHVRASQASITDERAGDPTRVEGRSDDAVGAENRAPSQGPTGAMGISHTVPFMPVPVGPVPSYPPPPGPPPKSGAPLFVGALVGTFAAVVIFVAVWRVSPRFRSPMPNATPAQASVAAPLPPSLDPPSFDSLASSDASAAAPAPAAAPAIASSATSAALPVASAAPKRAPPPRPAPRPTGDGIPTARAMPSTRE